MEVRSRRAAADPPTRNYRTPLPALRAEPAGGQVPSRSVAAGSKLKYLLETPQYQVRAFYSGEGCGRDSAAVAERLGAPSGSYPEGGVVHV